MKGVNYPIGYVRWTEQRHLEEFLRLVAAGQVRPSNLAPQVFKIEDAPAAYQQLHDHPGKHAVGILFEYPADAPIQRHMMLPSSSVNGSKPESQARIGLIGAGNFATATLIPALKSAPGVMLKAICSAGGLTAKSAARRHGFQYCASEYAQLLADEQINAVVIATHHDTHARFAAEALRAGKHVFVEKPLALTREQLEEVIAAQQDSGRLLMPGYNRRFSPLSIAVRDFFANRSSPIEVVCRVNAGHIKADSWYQDPEEGGWRIVSEGCHFVDLIQFICGCPPVRVFAEMIGGQVPGGQNDNCVVTLKMQDGSVASLIYVANGDPQFDKERIEVFGQGRSAVIENFRRAQLYAGRGLSKTIKARGKGHAEEISAFVKALNTGVSPISPREAIACTLATLAAADALRTSQPQVCDFLEQG